MYRECGEGWNNLIDDLEEHIQEIDPDVRVAQIKEKFGTLRYYCCATTNEKQDKVEEAIADATILSAHTCDVCGKEGRVRENNGWWKTTCEEHKL